MHPRALGHLYTVLHCTVLYLAVLYCTALRHLHRGGEHDLEAAVGVRGQHSAGDKDKEGGSHVS